MFLRSLSFIPTSYLHLYSYWYRCVPILKSVNDSQNRENYTNNISTDEEKQTLVRLSNATLKYCVSIDAFLLLALQRWTTPLIYCNKNPSMSQLHVVYLCSTIPSSLSLFLGLGPDLKKKNLNYFRLHCFTRRLS